MILVISFTSVSATTFYIDPSGSDSNDGSAGSPWASLSYAASQANTPGDVIHLNAGTYNVTSSINLSNGVSIKGEGVSSVISSSVGGSSYTLMLMGNSPGTNGNQSISNIKFDGNNLTAYAAIMVYQLSNVEINNCTFVDFNYYGVRFIGSGSPPVYETGNSFHDNTVTNCSGFFPAGEPVTGEGKGAIDMRAQDGMLIYNNELTQVSRPAGSNGYLIKGVGRFHKNLKIYNNIIKKAPFDGLTWDFAIELWDCRGGVEIYDNIISAGIDFGGYYNFDEIDAGYAVWVHDNVIGRDELSDYPNSTGLYIEQNSSDFVIENNTIKGCARGIFFSLHGDHKDVDNIQICYNVFENCGSSESSTNYSGYAINWAQNSTLQTVDSIFILNNTFQGLGTNKSMAAIKLPVGGEATNIFIQNNIIDNFFYDPIHVQDVALVSIDGVYNQNNIFHRNGNNNNLRNQTSVTITNYNEENIIKQDPLFVSTSDFNLQSGSSAIDAGVDVGLTKDYADNSIIGIPDVGAFEYQSQTTVKTTEDISICDGESYEGWTTTGQYERTLTAVSGADSIVTTNLTVNPVYYVEEDISILEGESYKGWTESGRYERTLVASTGCDSIVTTNLTVLQTIRTTEEIGICEGEYYEGWTVSGEYERTLTASSGADSVVTTLLTVHPVQYTTEDITIYEGESYEGWIESGEYERTLTASTGCDSIVITNLTVIQTIHTSEIIEICEGESYEGWTISGDYERTLTALSGADSVVTTLLIVHPVQYTTENISIYEGESYEGWTESGQYERTLVASTGCDSIVTTNLTVIQTIHTSENIEICEGESYEGWTTTGQFERTLTAASGADSIVTTNLTVNPVYSISEDISILEGESYQGWTESGQYERILTAITGCDSVVTTNLTVTLNELYTTEAISICEGESYEGWTTSGQYDRTLTAASGADSIVTTLLTVHPAEYTTEDVTIYEGESYEGWIESGEYERTLTASTGCDSIVTTNLTVVQTIHTTEEIGICEGESYEGWTVSGQYERTLTASSGADSVVTTLLTVHPAEYTTEYVTIYKGENYQGWTTSGEYQRELISTNGCDSIVTTNLSVEQLPAQTEPLQTQTIELEKGWNVFSTYLNPTDASMDSVMRSLVDGGELVLVEDEVPNTYEKASLKSTQSSWINNIGNVQQTEGYKIQVESSCVLEITGTPVSLPVTIELKRGENLISFPINGSVDAMQVIQPLIDANVIKKVQDEKGNSIENWRNLGWLNGIGNFNAGEGYIIDARHPGLLTINDITEKSSVFVSERPEPIYFSICYEGNGLDHMNINVVELNATNFRAGDEIAAFDGEICAGAIKLTETDIMNDAVSIPVSASELDEENGFSEGNPIELRVWHINKSAVSPTQSVVVEGAMMYQKRASVFIKMSNQTTTGIDDFETITIDMFPNPARDKVTVRFSTLPERETKVELTDMTGKQLMIREVQSNQEVLNIQSYPAGMYFVKIITGNHYQVNKLIKN